MNRALGLTGNGTMRSNLTSQIGGKFLGIVDIVGDLHRQNISVTSIERYER